MDIRNSYNEWSNSYDHVANATRDLEEYALKQLLSDQTFDHIIEVGCGTGKNTQWLQSKATRITAIDFSEGMLNKAQEKIYASNVNFLQRDINREWKLEQGADLICFSLVLEHIANLDFVFSQCSLQLNNGGVVIVNELHPFKQYKGSKARFEVNGELVVLQCYNHHISDYITAAANNGLAIKDVQEWFDSNDRNNIPRLLSLVFQKS